MSTYHYFAGSDTDVVIIPSAGMSIRLDHEKPMGSGKSPLATAAGGADAGLEPGAQPSAVKPQVFGLGAVGDLMPWGAGNDFPQRITALYSKDPIIPTTLGKIAAMVQGQGIIPVLEDVDEDGDVIRRPLPKNDPVAAKIRAFLTSRHFKQYMREMSSDATMYFNGWPELIISKNREEIVQLHPLNAEECRWCMMDDNGNLTHIFLDANWGNHIAQQSTSKKITALDPYNTDLVDWLRQRSEYNVVYPIRFPTPGQRYYSLPHHYSLVESGWLDVHLAVPQFKKFLLKNQMSIKYHVKVNTEYWPICFGADWDKAKTQPDKQKAMIKKWLDGVTAMLTNVENAGATLVTQVQAGLSDPSKVVDYVTVTVIQDPIKDGKYIQDNLEAAANIFYALNVDPTLVGFAGGEKMGARSGGSDKLQAYLIALQMLLPFREMLIEPLDFVADYNGWKAHFPLLKFVFPDQNPSAKKGDQKKEESKPAPDRKADKPTA